MVLNPFLKPYPLETKAPRDELSLSDSESSEVEEEGDRTVVQHGGREGRGWLLEDLHTRLGDSFVPRLLAFGLLCQSLDQAYKVCTLHAAIRGFGTLFVVRQGHVGAIVHVHV